MPSGLTLVFLMPFLILNHWKACSLKGLHLCPVPCVPVYMHEPWQMQSRHRQRRNISNEGGELSTICWDSVVWFYLSQHLTALKVNIFGAVVMLSSFPPSCFCRCLRPRLIFTLLMCVCVCSVRLFVLVMCIFLGRSATVYGPQQRDAL